MPVWVGQLVMAERWGIPPWEVGKAPLIWYIRQQAYDDAVAKGHADR